MNPLVRRPAAAALAAFLVSLAGRSGAQSAARGAGALGDKAGRAMEAMLKGSHLDDPDQDLDEPRGACGASGGRCYTPGQLENIAARLTKDWPDIRDTAGDVLRHPERSARQKDLDQIVSYLGNEQDGITFVRSRVGDDGWKRLKEDPAERRALKDKLAPEDFTRLRSYYDDSVAGMSRMIADGNPFQKQLLSARDIWTDAVMKKFNLPTPGQAAEPKEPAAWVGGAKSSLRLGDPKAAVQQARRALELDPRSAQAHSALAAAHYDLKQFDAALAEAAKALENDPTDAEAAAVLKLAHEAPQARVGAAPAFDSASGAAVEPSMPALGAAPGGGWASSLSAGAPVEAAARAAARDAEKALALGDFAAAERAAERAQALLPGFEPAVALRAYAELRQGRVDEALRDAAAAPSEPLARKTAAAGLLRLGRGPEALASARAAASAEPRSAYARFLTAEAYAATGDKANAVDALKEAAALDARYKQLYDAALQAPQESDLAFLFPDVKMPQGIRRAAPAVPQDWLVVSAGSTAGGLAAFALFWFAFWRRR